MPDKTEFSDTPDILLDAAGIAAANEALADRLSSEIEPDMVAIALMDGAFVFAADIMRALNRRGHNLAFDMLRLSSYGDGKSSKGSVDMTAGLARPVKGRAVLIVDDVFETGHTLAEARRQMLEAGATRVVTAVFALKSLPNLRIMQPDFYAWEAPQRFLVGYGLDYRGLYRGQENITALD